MRYPYLRVLLGLLVFFLSVSCVSAAEDATSTRSFLHMADGNWYDPTTGFSASTEQELRWKVYPELIPSSLPSAIEPSPASSPTTTPALADDFPLIKAIRRGREMLAAIATTTSVTQEPDWYEVDLVIWNSVRDDLQRVSIRKKGTDIQVRTPFEEDIRVLSSARLQSQYRVTASTGTSLVVALKYPLYHEKAKGKTTGYLREEVVYTPYAAALQTTDLTAWGKMYLDQTLKQIYDELETDKIASAAYPDRLVSEVIHPNLPKAVMLIEQSDARSLEEQPQEVLQRFYSLVGANEDRAYAYVESPAGASGPAQFIPSTYRLLAEEEEFHLNPNFQQGMRSLRNSLKAEVIYLDRLLGAMPDSIQTKHQTDPQEAQEYLVAAYNGGETRIRQAIAQYGDTWLEDRFSRLSGLKKKADVLDEQITSLKKKLKVLRGEKLTQAKKKLTGLQTQRQALSLQINALQKGALRPETLQYIVKYRQAIESLNQETAQSVEATSQLTDKTLIE